MIAFKSAFLLLALATVVLAAPIERRDSDTIIKEIDGINQGFELIIAGLKSYQGGGIASILVGFTEAAASNRAGLLDAQTSPKFDVAQAKAVVQTVVNTVDVSIPESVKLLKSKKSMIPAASIPLVEASLVQAKSFHDSFSAAVIALMPDNSAVLAEAARSVKVIDVAFQDGINYFAS